MAYLDNVNITDKDGNILSRIDFGSQFPGSSSNPYKLYIFNDNDISKEGIGIRPARSIRKRGEDLETVDSTFFSLDGVDFFNEVFFNIEAGEKTPVFVKWQPTYDVSSIKFRWKIQLFVRDDMGVLS